MSRDESSEVLVMMVLLSDWGGQILLNGAESMRILLADDSQMARVKKLRLSGNSSETTRHFDSRLLTPTEG